MSEVMRNAASCADPWDDSISVATALERILGQVGIVSGQETVVLADGLDRVLARPVISAINVPGHTNSAVDGYALAGEDLPSAAAGTFRVMGRALAGQPWPGRLGPGEVLRIMTGAPMPAGADTVVMLEHSEPLGDPANPAEVRIGAGHKPGQNVRAAGEDIAAGAEVVGAGQRLGPAELGVLASLGVAELTVHGRPRVAYFSTGNEIRSPGEPLAEGEIYDSNRHTLGGMLGRLGVERIDLGLVADDPARLRETLQRAAAEADLVITSGGVSVGDADYIKPLLGELGNLAFWKIAMKPGRPLSFGRLGNALFFGLPGNPVAVMVTFYQFVLPALRRVGGEIDYRPFLVPATCVERLRKKPGRTEYLRGVVELGDDGRLTVSRAGAQGSGILTSMTRANCFIVLDERCADVAVGEVVLVQPFAALA